MIKAKQIFWAHRVFTFWLEKFLINDFSAIYLLNPIPEINAETPVILTPNHSSWYDGFIPYWINYKFLKRAFYIVMLEEQLKKYSFFNKLGAIGIKPGFGNDIRISLNYLNTLLQPNHLIVYFPEGKIKPELQGEYELTKGLRYLTGNSNSIILPMRIRIESLNRRKPALFLSFEKPISHSEYCKNQDLLQQAFVRLRAQELEMLRKSQFGQCIYGIPHDGI